MDNETLNFIEQLETQNKSLQNRNLEYEKAFTSSHFQNQEDQNLIQWQLDTEDILDRIHHFLKGDIIQTDNDGNVFYKEQTNTELIQLNEYGINSIMQILGNYVNRINFLSYYNEERICEILGDLGDEIADFLFCNYEKMGLDTEFKKSRYKLLVLNILHLVESGYRRALFGKEREEINTGRTVVQSDNMGNNYLGNNQRMIQKKRKLFDPKTW